MPFLAHLSLYPLSVHHFQRYSPKPLGQSKPNFMWSVHGSWGTKGCSGYMGHMTNMAATPIYDKKKPSKIFFYGTKRADDLGPWFVALEPGPIKVRSNDDFVLTLTCFMARSNLVRYAFIWKKLLESHLMEETYSKRPTANDQQQMTNSKRPG